MLGIAQLLGWQVRERAEDLAGAIVDVVQKPFTLAEIKERIGLALG